MKDPGTSESLESRARVMMGNRLLGVYKRGHNALNARSKCGPVIMETLSPGLCSLS